MFLFFYPNFALITNCGKLASVALAAGAPVFTSVYGRANRVELAAPHRLGGTTIRRTVQGGFLTGSLAWQVDQPAAGEFLFRQSATKTHRHTCLRAIANVVRRKPDLEYDLDLWHALHHSGTGEGIRLSRIRRIPSRLGAQHT